MALVLTALVCVQAMPEALPDPDPVADALADPDPHRNFGGYRRGGYYNRGGGHRGGGFYRGGYRGGHSGYYH